ncbi:unnamed protein product [Parajaminaea phylloscopi]
MTDTAILGGSRGCGKEVIPLLLAQPDAHVHLLLRKPAEFDLTPFASVAERLHTYRGDALDQQSVTDFLRRASLERPLARIISSIGTFPVFTLGTLLKPRLPAGLEDICERAMRCLLRSMEDVFGAGGMGGSASMPSLTVLSSNASGPHEAARLPWALRWFYTGMLHHPHTDKANMERLLHRTCTLSAHHSSPTAP